MYLITLDYANNVEEWVSRRWIDSGFSGPDTVGLFAWQMAGFNQAYWFGTLVRKCLGNDV